MHIMTSGDHHILYSNDVYGGIHEYLREYSVEKHKYNVDFIDMGSL
jgi:hypothetical protein